MLPRSFVRAPRPGTTLARLALSRRNVGCIVALVILAGACKGDGGGPAGPAPSIAGEWTGTAVAHTVRFEASFTQSGDAVGGSGRFSSPVASGDFTVAGTLEGADVDLVLTSAELGTTAFRGRFIAADRIEGTFDPGGEYELDLTLDRE